MKHATLRSIGHNLADSLACGLSFIVGICETDIFGDAKRSRNGFVAVDFLNGTTIGERPSAKLAKCLRLYRESLPAFCEKHGVSVSAFKELSARFSTDGTPHSQRVLVTVEDSNGRRSTDEYVGLPLRHIKTVDSLGRVRTNRH